MPLIDDIIIKAEEVIATSTEQFILCAKLRISCEGWLKIELLRAFSTISQVTLHPEERNVDIVVRHGNDAVFLELNPSSTVWRVAKSEDPLWMRVCGRQEGVGVENVVQLLLFCSIFFLIAG
ncbi:MAG: hypothetical protein WCG52_08490 [bacterium]